MLKSISATAILLLLNVLLFSRPLFSQSVRINEFMASNSVTIYDEDGDCSDWLEIHNPAPAAVNLSGWSLTDKADNRALWVFPDITLEAGAYLVVFASGKDRSTSAGPLHTNFKLDKEGEYLGLFEPSGNPVTVFDPEYPEQHADISYAYFDEDYSYTGTPSPGEENYRAGYPEVLDPPGFSSSSGFFSAPFHVTLSHPDSAVTIIYTLDGSEPCPDNLEARTYHYKNSYPEMPGDPFGALLTNTYQSHQYTGPIYIYDNSHEPDKLTHISSTWNRDPDYFPDGPAAKGIVVRAKAFKNGLASGDCTNSYFVNNQGVNPYTLPLISIVLPEDCLFDYEKGIYVAGIDFDDWRTHNVQDIATGSSDANYRRSGEEHEYPAHFELFEQSSGASSLKQNIGVRIHGGWASSYPLKSLRLYARSDYGDADFDYQFFPDLHDNSFKRIILRNAGNDESITYIRDAAIQTIVSHLNFDTQAYRPAICFINGEYWGIHNIRERYDQHYLARVYDIDSESIDLLEDNALVKEGSASHYQDMINYIKNNDVEEAGHYHYIAAQMDITNYIDYQIAQIFADNTDWPHNNIDYWRYAAPVNDADAPYGHDGRWRWLMYDLDLGFGQADKDSAFAYNTLEWAARPDHWSTFLFRELLKNETFKNCFIIRFTDLLNTAFLPERTGAVINELKELIEPEIPAHTARWKNRITDWHGNIAGMIDFADNRPGHQRRHIREFFTIEGEIAITCQVSDPLHGHIRVNTVDITPATPGVPHNPYPWTGRYFSSIPVEIEAVPEPGYAFSHWTGAGTGNSGSPRIQLAPSRDDIAITAVFTEGSIELTELDPAASAVAESAYTFYAWSADEPEYSWPANMIFRQSDVTDPGIDQPLEYVYSIPHDEYHEADSLTTGYPYNNTQRTRINGLNDEGISFINTGRGRDLGGAVLALDTRAADTLFVSFLAGTVTPNTRVYGLRLQYRTGNSGAFTDVTDAHGDPVEYIRNETAGHTRRFGPLELPSALLDKPYVQLLWRYYHISGDSGPRAELRLDDIRVENTKAVSDANDHHAPSVPGRFTLSQNYPNPFNQGTQVEYTVPVKSEVTIAVYSLLGRQMLKQSFEKMPGTHTFRWNGTDTHDRAVESGVYIITMTSQDHISRKKMVLIR